MKIPELQSHLPWKRALEVGGFFTVPLVLSYIARSAITMHRGRLVPLTREGLETITHVSERRLAQQLLQIQEATGTPVAIFHEPVRVTTNQKVTYSIGDGRTRTLNKTVPDFLLSLHSSATTVTDMLGLEVTLGDAHCPRKNAQREVSRRAGLVCIAIGPTELEEAESTSDVRAKAVALLGHFSPIR